MASLSEMAAVMVTSMSARFKSYPACKSSGVEWLGEIPAHWEVKRLKYLAQVNPSRSELFGVHKDTEVSFLPMELVGNGTLILEKTRLIDEVGSGFTYFRDLDVLVAKITPSFENGKGAIARDLTNGIGFGTTELHIIRANDATGPEYLYYLTLTHSFRATGAALMYGTAGQKRVPDSFIRDFLVPMPTLDEQCAIAAFLDRETAKIDALIAKKERLIELLQEKRTALISHGVTKGLDPNVPMKYSGVEWLGEIPEHWEKMRIRDVAHSLQTGPFGSQLHSDDYSPGGIPVINPAHLKQGRIYPEENIAVDQETWNRLARHELREGDIVFARRGEMGRCALVTEREAGWLCGSGSLRMRPRMEIVYPPFLNWVLSTRGIQDWLSLESVGTTMDNLSAKIISDVPVSVPPLSEEIAIASFLNFETARIDALVAKVQEAIEKLREYRTTLISAAVTGKIDVRGEGEANA